MQEEFSVEIDAAKQDARNKILAEMDEKVIERLMSRKEGVHAALGDFRRALLALARAELPEAHFHPDHAERFDYQGNTWSTEWPEAEDNGWRFFRLSDGGLADQLVMRAKARSTPMAALEFDYNAYAGNLGDVASLNGQSGWMRLSRLTLQTPARTWDELICVAFTDDGRMLDSSTAERLLHIPTRELGAPTGQVPEAELVGVTEARQTALVGHAQERLGEFLNEEEDRLDAWRNDARVAYDQQIKELTKQANEKNKLARATANLAAKLELQHEAKALKRQVDELQHQLYTRLREIDNERDAMLDAIAEQLNLTPQVDHLFTIRWSLI